MAENDNDNERPLTYADEEEQDSGLFRWMSAMVVLLAVAGFFGLAWYAYRSGGEAVDDKDVEIVKADKTPVKEAPANPGGMQIPNQDKTVYGLINGGKTDKPTVERVLPVPEEPVARTGDTETWMSDKARKKINGEDEKPEIPLAPVTPPAATPLAALSDNSAKKPDQFNPAVHPAPATEAPLKVTGAAPMKPAPDTKPLKVTGAAPLDVAPAAGSAKPVTDVDMRNAPALAPPPPSHTVVIASEPTPAQQKVPATSKPSSIFAAVDKSTPASSSAPPKGARVQLGAYKSESEAESNWTRISKRVGAVKDKQHYVVRADLGDKGVFYRLQLAPFDSTKDAGQFCAKLSGSGQNCIVAKGK